MEMTHKLGRYFKNATTKFTAILKKKFPHLDSTKTLPPKTDYRRRCETPVMFYELLPKYFLTQSNLLFFTTPTLKGKSFPFL